MIDLKDIEKVCKEFNNDVDAIEKKIKSIQSKKCKMLKLKRTSTYDADLAEVLKYEQVLKEAKSSLVPAKKFVTSYSQEDVDRLDYDESVKAIKSIQSKKCLSQQFEDQAEYDKAVAIELMIKEHIKTVKPVDESYIRRTDLNTVIETIENNITSMPIDKVLELLRNL